MSSFFESVQTNKTPGLVNITVPSKTTKTLDTLTGTLRLTKEGYLYSEQTRTTIWLKLAALSIYLPFAAVAAACGAIAERCLGRSVPQKGLHDLGNSFHLAGIALKGAIGWGSLAGRAEQFALAELDYNAPKVEGKDVHSSRFDYLTNTARSDRLKDGVYSAPCFQPIFHKNQVKSEEKLGKKIQSIKNSRNELEKALEVRDPSFRKNICHTMMSKVTMPFNKYKDLTVAELKEKIKSFDTLISTLEKLLVASKRCEKYAIHAIREQHFCPDAVETQADVKCCGITCFKHQKICGLLHKIECCAKKYWAMNCCGLFCCIWPEGERPVIVI